MEALPAYKYLAYLLDCRDCNTNLPLQYIPEEDMRADAPHVSQPDFNARINWEQFLHPLTDAGRSNTRLLPVVSSVMQVVTSKGRVLTRNEMPGRFQKVCCGTGCEFEARSLIYRHHAAREELLEQFGIGFQNKAILDISPPILTLECPHTSNAGRTIPS